MEALDFSVIEELARLASKLARIEVDRAIGLAKRPKIIHEVFRPPVKRERFERRANG